MSFDPQSLIGQTVGEFKLTALLSRTDSVIRYRAEHQKLRRVATCHVLDPRETSSHGQAFLDGARRISQIRQRNLIDIFDSGTILDSPYFVSEELLGEPLLTWCSRHRFSVSRLFRIAQQVEAALLAIDQAGAAVSALSPDSLFVRRVAGSLQVKLVDVTLVPVHKSNEQSPTHISISVAATFLFGLVQAQPFAQPLPALPLSRRSLFDGVGRLSGLGDDLEPVLRRGLGIETPPFDSLRSFLSAALATIPKRAPLPLENVRAALRKPRTWLFAGPLILLLLVPLALLLHRPRTKPPVAEKTYTVRELHDLARTTLEAGLRSPLPLVREQALTGLLVGADIGWQAQVEPLLDDPSPSVQTRAAEVLGGLGSRRTLPTLEAHLGREYDPIVRATSSQSIHKLGKSVNRAAVSSLLTGDNVRAKRIAAQLLAEQGDAEAERLVAELQGQTGEEAQEARLWAARRGQDAAQALLRSSLPKTPPLDVKDLPVAELFLRQEVAESRELLVATAKQPGPAQTRAAQILCKNENSTFLPLLRDVVVDAGRALPERLVAASGLARCGERRDGQLLARLVLDGATNERLKQGCAGALLALTSRDPDLSAQQNMAWAKQALDDESWSVRESAVALLGESETQEPERQAVAKRTETVESEKPASQQQVVQLLVRAMDDAALPVRMTAMRSAVKVARKSQKPSEQDSLKQSLRKRAETGLPEEQIVAAASLLRIGDASYRDTLHKGLRAAEVAVRRRAIEEADADPKLPSKLLVPLTNDQDFAVRFGAAALLVAQGQKKPALVQTLREAVQRGGSEGVRAYALLQKLGELSPQTESKAPDLDTLLASSNVLERLMAIDALQKLPAEEAAPLLLKATRDPDSTVRFRLVDVVAHHCQPGPSQRAALPALRALAEDHDVAVRARAFELLSQLQATLSKDGDAGPDAAKADGKTDSAAGNSENAMGESPPALSPEAARKSQSVDQQFASGSALFKAGNYRGAQKALEKTSQMCTAYRGDVPKCTQIGSNLSYQLGVTYENLGQLASAMTEYQKVLQGTGGGKGGKRPRGLAISDAAQQGVERLRGKLGRLVLYKTLAGKCQKVEVYMPPGKHQVNVGGAVRKPVELDAGETVELRNCR